MPLIQSLTTHTTPHTKKKGEKKMAKETITFYQVEHLILPEGSLDMFEAFELLEKENERLLREETKGRCTVVLADKKGHTLFSYPLSFPLNQDIEDVIISKLSLIEPKKKEKKVKEKSSSKTRQKRPLEADKEFEIAINDTKQANVIGKRIETYSEEDATKETRRQRKETRNKVSFHHNMGTKRLLVLLGLVCLLSVGAFGIMSSQGREEQAVQIQDMFQQELRVLTPKELAEKYPNQAEKIVQYYVEKKEFSSLIQFNRAYPTPSGTFEVSFYQKDWEKVIQTEDVALSDTRKIMLAHAYINLGQLEEASVLNQSIKSDTLSEAIDIAYIEKGVALLHQRKMNEAKDLLQNLQTTEAMANYQVYLDDASLIVQMIDLYKKNKEVENQALWERKLKDIGKDVSNDI